MPSISQIQLPSGNVYEIKDAEARRLIAGGVTFIVAWDGSSAPDVSKIPAGVVVYYNSTAYTGTLTTAAAQSGAFYLVRSSTQVETLDIYDEYSVVGAEGSKTWEKLGDTSLDLSSLGTLAYKDAVALNKGAGDMALGEDTSFSASGTAVGADGTANAVTGFPSPTKQTFVKSVSAETNKKLVTTTVPNVTNVGAPSSWNFAMGSGNDAETLIISGANGSAPTLGTAITAATGETDANGGGDPIVTGVSVGESAEAITALGTPSTAAALTGVKVTSQPTITVGTNDKVKVAKYDDLGVAVS